MCNAAENTAAIASGRRVLTVEVYRGFTLQQIVALLNWHEALIQDGEIVAFTAAHADAAYPMCRIITDNEEPAGMSWSVSDPAAPQPPACSGCSGCTSGCACDGNCRCR